MHPATDVLRFVWAMALVVLPVIAGYRFSRRFRPPLGAMIDAILIGYLLQYISVGIAGLLGILTPIALTLLGLGITIALWIGSRYIPQTSEDNSSVSDRRWMTGVCLGATGFVAAIIYSLRLQPPLATDTLTYHLPAAVLWLQNRRIVLFQAWFFNPANTYSPLAGSMFDAWLMAPIGNDVLARFVQIGPWILILLAVTDLARRAGASTAAAALAGLAAVLSRPFISECVLAKDDFFVAAFFLVAAGALAKDRCRRFDAVRVGVSLGLMLAMKYTSLTLLPMLALAADAPFRAKWRLRQWYVAAVCVALIAGPWYLRNLLYFGNPVFPVKIMNLPGLFSSVHVRAFETLSGAWDIITGGYFGLPPIVFVVLILVWLVAIVRSGKSLFHDPLRRLVVLGPVVGVTTFVLFSPQAEVRFLFPAFALMFVASAISVKGSRGVAVVVIIVTIAVCTSFIRANANQIVIFSVCGIAVALAGLLIRWLESDCLIFRRPILSIASTGILFLIICAWWSRYLGNYRDARYGFWQSAYPSHGVMWDFVDRNVPASATIAYSNQFMIYPLYGFEYHRHVVYAPVRAGASVANLIFLDRMPDSEFFVRSMEAANSPADLDAWKRNLRSAAAQYLIVGVGKNAPEIGWAESEPAHFAKIFANEQAIVYRIDDLDKL